MSAPSASTRCIPCVSLPKPVNFPAPDPDFPEIADDVEDDEKARDHAIMTVRASSSEIA